jgi:integrase/recombinase XerD
MRKIDFNAECAKYLALRKSIGLRTDQIGPLLEKLAKYLNDHCGSELVRPHHILKWACLQDYSSSTQHVRLSAARVFLKHLKAFVPEIEIPSYKLIGRRRRKEPFVFSKSQLPELLDIAGKLGSRKSLAPLTVQTMVGLMACTGLRPGEVMRLKTSHVLLDERPPRLLIFRTKFAKTRWVPLHATTVDRLRLYLNQRDELTKGTDSDFFFVSKRAKPINRITFHRIFQQLIAQAGIRARSEQLRPTLHSLRHTFAILRLKRWYSDGQNVRSLLPNLSVYLGHVDPAASYWYLTSTPELMTAAAQRFEIYAGKQKGGQQ